ncbi:hypothetical protein J4H86_05990 [Spiractinospora alimapuensis]|uniref:hypothetical protein n=1 Tax=Spiractinospora alimapuensis TaxID=2820884 RepID=UPI001F2AB1B2|nr:hypothetical protein [Spiractinospora alimapuensis]QVQ53317.1 hypothetical protein J4H86_05990 [Spiractinospora alimapuensis]
MTLYEVQARKWENGWELRVDGAGQTWSPSLDDAEARVREHIQSAGASKGAVHVTLVPRVDDDTDRLALEARRAVAAADEATRDAVSKTRDAVQGMSAAGLPPNDIARILEISPGRLAELTAESAPDGRDEPRLPQRRRRQ